MHSTVKIASKSKLTKWEKREKARCEKRGEVYTRGGLVEYAAAEEGWNHDVIEGAAENNNLDVMEPYNPNFQVVDPEVLIGDGILGHMSLDPDTRIGYSRYSTLDSRQTTLLKYNELLKNYDLIAVPRPGNVYIVQDYNDGKMVCQGTNFPVVKIHNIDTERMIIACNCTPIVNACIHSDVIHFARHYVKHPLDDLPYVPLHIDKTFKIYAVLHDELDVGPQWRIVNLSFKSGITSFKCNGPRCIRGNTDRASCRHIDILLSADEFVTTFDERTVSPENEETDASVSHRPIPPPLSLLCENEANLWPPRVYKASEKIDIGQGGSLRLEEDAQCSCGFKLSHTTNDSAEFSFSSFIEERRWDYAEKFENNRLKNHLVLGFSQRVRSYTAWCGRIRQGMVKFIVCTHGTDGYARYGRAWFAYRVLQDLTWDNRVQCPFCNVDRCDLVACDGIAIGYRRDKQTLNLRSPTYVNNNSRAVPDVAYMRDKWVNITSYSETNSISLLIIISTELRAVAFRRRIAKLQEMKWMELISQRTSKMKAIVWVFYFENIGNCGLNLYRTFFRIYGHRRKSSRSPNC
ncbi:hypothetical protein BC829DRAFT_423246 [Chytridium lagenaria]|nr:hypothetical protein BC829DRAFT_423246 [Chytridium lagenaria]